MDERKLTVLLVEDSPGDARFIQESLREARADHILLEHVKFLKDAERRVAEGGVDVILLDLFLPDNMGPDTVTRMVRAADEVPIVVLTGLSDAEAALDSLRNGAREHLFKGRIEPSELRRTLERAAGYRPNAAKSQRADPGAAAGPGVLPPFADALARATEAARAELHVAIEELSPRDRRGLARPASRLVSLAHLFADAVSLEIHEAAPRSTPAAEAFDQALSRLAARNQREGLSFQRTPLPDVHADPWMLSRLFEAVLAHAVATAPDGRIALSAKRQGEEVRFELEGLLTGDERRSPELLLAGLILARAGGQDRLGERVPSFTLPGSVARLGDTGHERLRR